MYQAPTIIPAGGRYWIKRLNVLLHFAHEDLGVLTNGDWENLLDRLYVALLDAKRDRNPKMMFNRIATRESVREAQKGLDRIIRLDPTGGTVDLELARQELTLGVNEDGRFFGTFASEHFGTNVYMAFWHLLEASLLNRSDFKTCANDKCGYPFIPLRKPRDDERAYCSTKCRNRVAAIEYRKAKGDQLKEKERLRSEKRYAAKVAKKFPKAKVKKKKPK